MTSDEFRQWRSAMGLTQLQAAGMLGLSKSTIELYESGKRRDNDQLVEIPKVVALACAALRRENGDDPSLEARLQQWHVAAANKYRNLLNTFEDGPFIARNHFHLSYGIAHREGQEVDPSNLVGILREINEQVYDRVRTGWSMFYIFSRAVIRPRTSVDPASGKGEDDFVECTLLDASDTGATDYWRASRDGFATLMRGYFEDRPDYVAHLRTERGHILSPNWLTRDLAELVRHAQAFAEHFTDATSVSFRCAFNGLSNRDVYDPRAFWTSHKFDVDSATRISTGTWSPSDLRDKWPAIVAKLAAPAMRAAGIANVVTPEWVRGQASLWKAP
jgi:transcriptional regulator with XRE-family HTH domain